MTKNDAKLTAPQRAIIRREVEALEAILVALSPLASDERRRLLRWACERYGIDPSKLTHGLGGYPV